MDKCYPYLLAYYKWSFLAQLKTAYDAWQSIEAYFLDKTAFTAFSLKSELRSIIKGSMSMSYYMQKIKSIGDALRRLVKPRQTIIWL